MLKTQLNSFGKQMIRAFLQIMTESEIMRLAKQNDSFVTFAIKENPRIAHLQTVWQGTSEHQQALLKMLLKNRKQNEIFWKKNHQDIARRWGGF